jgi:hypothetical protein
MCDHRGVDGTKPSSLEHDIAVGLQVCRLVGNPKVVADVSKRLHGCYGDKRHKEVNLLLFDLSLFLTFAFEHTRMQTTRVRRSRVEILLTP